MEDAYHQGYDARLALRALTANPYAPGTEESEDWRGGWHDADADVDAGYVEEEA